MNININRPKVHIEVSSVGDCKNERKIFSRISDAQEKIECALARLRPQDLKMLNQGLRQLNKIEHYPTRWLTIGDMTFIISNKGES